VYVGYVRIMLSTLPLHVLTPSCCCCCCCWRTFLLCRLPAVLAARVYVAAGAPGFRGLPRPHQQRLRAAAVFTDTRLLLLLLLAPHAGFQLSSQLGFTWLLVPLGLGASLGLTSSGLVLQTQGFKHGSALVVCTTAAAASIVAGESV
jgi:hypothetical protein